MKIFKAGLFFAVIWTAAFYFFIFWFLRREDQRIVDDARLNATVQIQMNVLFRDWVALHGGVYVPSSSDTPPNPYLRVPERDVITVSGKQLTLVNPAYMHRQLSDLQRKNHPDLCVTHLTSLHPIRSENSPEPWERSALEKLTHGARDFYSVESMGGKKFLCVMTPLWTQKDCLKCHGVQGDKEGDLRGGLSTMIPMGSISAMSTARTSEMLPSFFVFWVIGVMGIGWRAVWLNRVEKKLKHAKESAEAGDKVKSEFLATMSHEVRTPMNGVIGLADLLMKTPLDGQQKKYVHTIQNCGRSLLTLLDDILDISELDAGAVSFHEEAVNLREMMDEIKLMFQPLADGKGLAIDGVIQEGVPEFITIDRTRLRQILVNLIGNALKFTSQGGIQMNIVSRGVGERELLWEIRDTGIGIEPEVLSRLFKPFSRGAPEIVRNYDGVGLGLAIAQQLSQKIGGRIEVTSCIGQGSTFTLTLPMKEARIVPKMNIPRDVLQEKKRHLKILVAEDNELNSWVLMQMLQQLGHAAEVASDGESALRLLESGAFELILMDIRMPKMDGCEVVRRIRALEKERGCVSGKRVYVVALTAYAMPGDRENFLNMGMDDYLAKPTTMESLEKVLTRFVVLRG